MKNNVATYSGAFLLVLSMCGIFHAARVALAQSLYFCAKFRTPVEDCQSVVDLCEAASQLYENNYYACILAAETAYYGSFKSGCGDVTLNIIEAQHWCDKGLRLNPYRMPLRRMKACLLARTSPAEAVRCWEEFVDWQYWEPGNHELLIELCALAGQYEKALDSLLLIKDMSCYQNARMKLDAAWKKEKDFPRELFEKP